MNVSDFDFQLPDELIARFPLAERSASRLLTLDAGSGGVAHRQFGDLLALLKPDDLLVFNNTKVLAARLFGQKQSGGQIEILVERLLSEHEVLAHCRASKPLREGGEVILGQGRTVRCLGRDGDLFQLHSELPWPALLDEQGHMPLPPYIDRADAEADRERYQTVYASTPGAVAAPTAGLHFDEAMLNAIKAKGIATTFVTLHVGAGTFQPVRVQNIHDHHMHAEWLQVGVETVAAVQACKARGGRVVAVGTTSVRALESAAAQSGELQVFSGDTRIFIFPGYRFKVIDALLTNFHLPQSTLLMLVSALTGREAVLAAYQEAIEQRYRFFSYGDAMFIARDLSTAPQLSA